MTTERRGFIAQLSLAAGALVGVPTLARAMRSDALVDAAPEAWLAGLKGKHRQMFDVAAHGNGRPLLRAATFLNVFNSAYGARDSDVNVVFGCHGDGLALVLNDKLWAHYNLGAHYNVEDAATKAPAVRNPFAGLTSPSAIEQSVAGLQKRGVRFLGCMQSVARLSKALAAKTGEKESDVNAAVLAGFLPGVTAVPALIVAVNRAQESGLTYAYLG